jgi:predicted MFS family arabinose efflux permease
MSQPGSAWLKGLPAVLVFGLFAFAYLLSFAMRSVSAVIAPEMVHDFQLTNAQLGSLGSAYFLAFAALQLPLGIWLDRFGSRRTHATLLLLSVLGCVLFASAQSTAMLWVGRGLMGAGVAGALMAALKAFRFWYPPQRQQSLAAWMLMTGSLGALSATVPARWLINLVGWRGVLPRDEERFSAQAAGQGLQSNAGAPASLWGGYQAVFRDRYFWRFALLSLVTHASFVSVQSLWAGPWLIQVSGYSAERAAQILLLFNLTLMVGFLLVGVLMPWVRRRGWSMVRMTAIGVAIVIVLQLAIALNQWPIGWLLWPIFAFASTFMAMIQPHVSLTFPAALTGRAYTAYNLLIFLGIFGWQWLFGVIIDLLRATGLTNATAFRGSLLFCITTQILGLVVFCCWRAQPRAQT